MNKQENSIQLLIQLQEVSDAVEVNEDETGKMIDNETQQSKHVKESLIPFHFLLDDERFCQVCYEQVKKRVLHAMDDYDESGDCSFELFLRTSNDGTVSLTRIESNEQLLQIVNEAYKNGQNELNLECKVSSEFVVITGQRLNLDENYFNNATKQELASSTTDAKDDIRKSNEEADKNQQIDVEKHDDRDLEDEAGHANIPTQNYVPALETADVKESEQGIESDKEPKNEITNQEPLEEQELDQPNSNDKAEAVENKIDISVETDQVNVDDGDKVNGELNVNDQRLVDENLIQDDEPEKKRPNVIDNDDIDNYDEGPTEMLGQENDMPWNQERDFGDSSQTSSSLMDNEGTKDLDSSPFLQQEAQDQTRKQKYHYLDLHQDFGISEFQNKYANADPRMLVSKEGEVWAENKLAEIGRLPGDANDSLKYILSTAFDNDQVVKSEDLKIASKLSDLFISDSAASNTSIISLTEKDEASSDEAKDLAVLLKNLRDILIYAPEAYPAIKEILPALFSKKEQANASDTSSAKQDVTVKLESIEENDNANEIMNQNQWFEDKEPPLRDMGNIVVDTHKYNEQLMILVDQGFSDLDKNVRILDEVNGDISEALEKLLE